MTSPRRGNHSSPLSTFSDPEEDARKKALDGALDKPLKWASMDDFTVQKGRNITLSANQVDPYIGSSLVKRIMYGVTPSPTIYDPFANVDDFKASRLIEYVKTYL